MLKEFRPAFFVDTRLGLSYTLATKRENDKDTNDSSSSNDLRNHDEHVYDHVHRHGHTHGDHSTADRDIA